MRPYIICHMMSLLDGRIDCDLTEQIESGDEYYDALNKLDCPSMLMGRVTMEMHYALPEPFVAENSSPIGEEQFHKAMNAKGYLVAIDTTGKLRWPQNLFDGMPLLVITSADCPKEYLDILSRQQISWIATGRKSINLKRAMEILYKAFNVERLSLTGGGHINGAFLKEGLIDEVSMMWCPGIDGRKGMASVFDGLDMDTPPTKLQLVSVEKMGETIWAKYKTNKNIQ
ncbi:MAG: RibD family protein [Bacteroides sp.]|nr:RibD family protein [Bacteroides sp.]